MSKKKPAKKDTQDWQKIERTSATPKVSEKEVSQQENIEQEIVEQKDSQQEKEVVFEPQSESKEEMSDKADNRDCEPSKPNEQKEQKEKKETLPEKKKHTDKLISKKVSSKEKTKGKATQKVHKRKYSAAVPIGGFFVLLAVIGLITVIVFGVRATENLIDNSKQKKEFENKILPVLMFDPVPFENPNEMGDLALLRSSIWSAIIENNEKYIIGDGNMVSVPQSDVDVACAKLFGSEVTLHHQSFEDYLSIYSLDEETKTYYVPVDATVLYTPQIEEITKHGDVLDLTVGYLAPDNQWMQSIRGETSKPIPSKYMIYEMKKVDNDYQLIGIKDPPDGAVPEIPQISDNAEQATPPVPITEKPQIINPESEKKEEPEQPEEQPERSKPENPGNEKDDQEVAQA